MQLIAKNQNAEIKSLYIRPGKTVQVPASGQKDLLSEASRHEISQANDVVLAIVEADIVINDGSQDLSMVKAFDLVRDYRPDEVIHSNQNKVTQDADVQMRPIGMQFTATQGTTTDYEWKLPETLCLQGGTLHVTENAINDKIDLKIVDKDNALGYGAGFVISDYVKDWNIPVSGVTQIKDESISDPISSVFYLKVSYTAGSGTDRKVCLNLLAYIPTS